MYSVGVIDKSSRYQIVKFVRAESTKYVELKSFDLTDLVRTRQKKGNAKDNLIPSGWRLLLCRLRDRNLAEQITLCEYRR